MTILFCLSHINKSIQWLWYAEELKNRGIKQVYVIIDYSNGIENYFYKDIKELGLPVFFLRHKGKVSHVINILKTVSLIFRYKASIVHTSLPFGNLVGQTAARMAGIKNRVTTCENVSWAHDFSHRKQERIDNFTFSSSRKIIATSEIAADYLRKNWNFDKSKLSVIYHGVKSANYDVSANRVEKLRNALKINGQKQFIVGVVSRFEYWKGHEYIIKAAKILQGYSEIKFYIFGSKGSFYEEAMQKINEFGLKDKVIYGGFVEDTFALYKLFDVHLHVPVNEFVETGGITIIEGMMAAIPQVLTKSGYAWQSAGHMKNSYVVDYENAEAIANAILFMKENYQTAKQLAAQAHIDALNTYGLKEKIDKHIALYNDLLK